MQHVVFSPGMFGFGQLASFNYFTHLEHALARRFADAGIEVATHVVDVLPTASVRRRAAALAELVAVAATGDDAIHLVGHSTGGLDARLVASPAARLGIPAERLAWLPRLRSITTMNTPHRGTPLARFFTTASGQRALYALSAFTMVGLSIGARPLALASSLLGIVGKSHRALGVRVAVLDRSMDSLLRVVDDARSPTVKAYLAAIKDDQGSMLQLSPEAMDLFVAGFGDRPGVRYQSTVSMAPRPSPRSWMQTLGHPWRSASLALFAALHGITAFEDDTYPCAELRAGHPFAGEAAEARLLAALGRSPDLNDNDGVVPIRSQLWGNLVWAGLGDHLDVLGHYLDREGTRPAAAGRRAPAPPVNAAAHAPKVASADSGPGGDRGSIASVTSEPRPDVGQADPVPHRDWLTSGSEFTRARFDGLVDAIAAGMLGA